MIDKLYSSSTNYLEFHNFSFHSIESGRGWNDLFSKRSLAIHEDMYMIRRNKRKTGKPKGIERLQG